MKRKTTLILILLFLSLGCLAYQKLVAVNLGEIVSSRISTCSELTIVHVNNAGEEAYTTSDKKKMADVAAWASDLEGKYSSIGDEFFSEDGGKERVTIYFKTSENQVTTLKITGNGHFAEALKRYEIVTFSNEILTELIEIAKEW